MGDITTSIIRTITPIIVGWILSVPITGALGINETTLTAAVSAALAALYHAVVRLLESRWPAAGRMLGSARQPEYTISPPSVETL